MDKLFKTLFIFSMITTLYGNSIGVCKGCHGEAFEISAQGKSRVIKDMSREEIKEALYGYKKRAYGGVMKKVMEVQVGKLTFKDIDQLIELIDN